MLFKLISHPLKTHTKGKHDDSFDYSSQEYFDEVYYEQFLIEELKQTLSRSTLTDDRRKCLMNEKEKLEKIVTRFHDLSKAKFIEDEKKRFDQTQKT